MINHSNNNSKKGCIAAALSFPPISWWEIACRSGIVYLDPEEHFQKMSYRNRYYLASKQGKMMLSLPLAKGRDQHQQMKEVQISYAEDWQKNHWRSIQTVLGNSPFFEYIDYQLFPFFENNYISLYEWNKASIEWANNFLGQAFEIREIQKDNILNDEDYLDLRKIIHPKNNVASGAPYHQVFQEHTGFLSDCSILDLICCEGKNAINILRP